MKTMEEIDWNKMWKNAMEDMVEEGGDDLQWK
jgi:hypothetical protein